jgi:hypothetical protein
MSNKDLVSWLEVSVLRDPENRAYFLFPHILFFSKIVPYYMLILTLEHNFMAFRGHWDDDSQGERAQPEEKIRAVGMLKDTLVSWSFKVISRMKISGNYGISCWHRRSSWLSSVWYKDSNRRNYCVSATEEILMRRKIRHLVTAWREVW